MADVLVRHQDAIITSTHAVQPSHWEKEHRLLGAPADGAFIIADSGSLLGAEWTDDPFLIYDTATQRLGLGTSTPGVSPLSSGDYKLHVRKDVDANMFIAVENADATGQAAAAIIRAMSDDTFLNFQGHGSGRVLSRWGVTLASWAELLSGGTGNQGLAIGSVGSVPVILGTEALAAITIGAGDQNVKVHTYLKLPEQASTPANPASGTECHVYMKADKFILQYNEGGTIRYKYLDLTGTGVTWVHTTTAP